MVTESSEQSAMEGTAREAVVPWIETRKWQYNFGWRVVADSNNGKTNHWSITPEDESKESGFDKWLNEIVASLNKDQWEIKNVLVLDRGRAATYADSYAHTGGVNMGGAGWGAGHGFGASIPWKVYILTQRTEYITFAEYQRRQDALRREKERKALENKRAKLKAEDDKVVEKINNALAQKGKQERERNRVAAIEIASRVKKLSKKEIFIFDGEKYDTPEQAQAAKDRLLKKHDQKIKGFEQEIEKLKAQRPAIPELEG